MELLGGRTALVTGGGRGIGRAITHRLAAAGATVVIVARSSAEIHAVADEITRLGGRSLARPADLADDDIVSPLAAELLDTVGSIDIIVNNAARASPVGPFTSIDPREWAHAITLNLIAPFRLAHAFLPAMIDAGWGRVLNISSVAAKAPGLPGGNAYTTGKAALEALTINLAAEVDGTGVTVNVLRPGASETSLHRELRTQDAERVGSAFLERLDRPVRAGLVKDPDVPAAAALDLICSDANGRLVDLVRRHDGAAIVDEVSIENFIAG